MSTTLKLREQRASVFEQMKALNDKAEAENRDLTGEEKANYEKLDTELDSLGARIDRAEGLNTLTGEFSSSEEQVTADRLANAIADTTPKSEYGKVFSKWITGESLDSDETRTLRSGFDADAVKMAAGVGTGAAGGYTVPPEFRDKFVETMKWYGPMLNEAEIITTDTGANLQWPTNDDTANVGAILAENTQVTEQDFTFGSASLDAYMYTSKLVRASIQFLQDNSVNADTWLPARLGVRIGRILNQHFTTGTGVSQPDGIVTSASVGVTGSGSFAAAPITFDNVIDLVEALDPAYGSGPGLKFMGHQSVRRALRKAKDSSGKYIWEPSTQVGAPDSLLGYPFVLNNDMAALATGSKSLLFGNIRQAYVARIVKSLTVLRLVERYADYLQVGFLGFERADGTMQDANAIRVFQTTATA